MKKKISDRQIVLELNPTSNIYIGEFKSFKDYHILNLSSPKKKMLLLQLILMIQLFLILKLTMNIH
ncbi:hypothetical protein CYK68_06170 [Clostridium perfringens]|nr:hypothetical protein CYK68_06170 [Clostridium perfringens]